jgi:hypothetical protein
MFWGRRRRRDEKLAQLDTWRTARRLMDEDVTVLGEQVAELHVDTLSDDLDPVARDHYRRALEGYDQAKHLAPEARMVRMGDRWVPWHEAGGISAIATSRRAVAQGAYGDGARRVVDQAAVEINARGASGGFGI